MSDCAPCGVTGSDRNARGGRGPIDAPVRARRDTRLVCARRSPHHPCALGSRTQPTFSAGSCFSLAIKADGSLWAWGVNDYGQLGVGTQGGDHLDPVRIGASTDWATVAGSSRGHSLALKTDGSLWGWGLNHYGELGDGTTHDRSAPTRIGTGKDWMAIAGGSIIAWPSKTDGSLWAWGLNEAGQLGDGTTEDRLFPTRVGSADDWVAVAAGYYHSLGLRSDGSLWAWGENEHGQVGDGTRSLRSNPTRIGLANDWVAVAAGSGYSLALQSDGSLWAWGEQRVRPVGRPHHHRSSAADADRALPHREGALGGRLG